ncbi:hypothetical protein OROGR_018600 [Orobanche gracilis]
MPETTSSVDSRRFGDLRGVQWRVDLGILPSSPSASIDDLRRVTANSRRGYASLRKQLLVDPHLPKDGGSSPDPVMDNPLSQDPAQTRRTVEVMSCDLQVMGFSCGSSHLHLCMSMWSRFFRNAELERMVDQDLTRLYPERGSYFQTSGCQGMLRRILLLWCLGHPVCGYRQGMHELLAPLLYVLHVDIKCLLEVRKSHEDHFADNFDGFSYHENNSTYRFDFKRLSDSSGDDRELQKSSSKASSLTGLDLVTQTIVLLSDAYGAEGELGTVLSEKFMEHDGYSMFDALMSGARGVVAMSDFFSPCPSCSHSGFTPVIEASSAIYHLLSIVDSSLHTHLVELGVEPQYFSLRWLRVLFGREFSLENLLLIWDETFACDNTNREKASEMESYFRVLGSSRGAFISTFAVSMILKLRSSLLATENATVCLQRLLNFPNDVNLTKLISKAKSLQALAMDLNNSNAFLVNSGLCDGKKSVVTRGHTLSLDSASPRTPLKGSYWEEKWRVLHKEGEKLSRSESDPSSSKKIDPTKTLEPSVRRTLLEDLARQLQDDNKKNAGCNDDDKENKHQDLFEVNRRDVTFEKYSQLLNEANFPDLSDPNDPNIFNGNISDQENGPKSNSRNSSSSSVASNSSMDENDLKKHPTDLKCDISSKYTQNDSMKNSLAKERKVLSGKFRWLWKLGRNGGEGTSPRPSISEDAKGCDDGSERNNVRGSFCTGDGCDSSSETTKGETVDQNLMVSLRNLGESMLENIQVIESVLQVEDGSSEILTNNVVVGKERFTAMIALEELRKISSLLSEIEPQNKKISSEQEISNVTSGNIDDDR